MELFYVDRRLLRYPGPAMAGGALGAAAVTAMLDRRTLPDGMPLFVDGAWGKEPN